MTRRPRRQERECGACAACCYLLTIPSVEKLAGEPCKHQAETMIGGKLVWGPEQDHGFGCAIYKTRPAECRTYACLWLRGHGDDAMRPDRSGVIFDGHGEPGTVRAIALDPVAFESALARRTVEALESHTYTIVYLTPKGDGRRHLTLLR